MSDSVWPHRWQPNRLPRPWDSPGKNTGVGCHFLLQCMRVRSESEVAQSCPTPSKPMDCSLPGSSVHGIFQARVLEWGAIAFYAIYTRSLKCFKPNARPFCSFRLLPMQQNIDYLWDQVVQVVKNPPAHVGTVRDPSYLGLSLGREYPLEEGTTALYSCLENPMDRGAWWVTVHRATESDTMEAT